MYGTSQQSRRKLATNKKLGNLASNTFSGSNKNSKNKIYTKEKTQNNIDKFELDERDDLSDFKAADEEFEDILNWGNSELVLNIIYLNCYLVNKWCILWKI